MFNLLLAILCVAGCRTKALPDAVGNTIDTGETTEDTGGTGGGTTDCETPPDGFEATLVRGHSCSNIFIERHNEEGTIQVTFSDHRLDLLAEARIAMETQVTMIDLADAGSVIVKMGENLGADACTCVVGMEVIEHRYVAVAGTAEVEVTPDEDDESDDGFATVRLSGVVLSDEDSCELTLGDMEFSGSVGQLIG